MLIYLYQLSDITLFFLLSVIAIIISIPAIYIVNQFIPLELRYRDNPIIGNTSALINIIYGVLAALAALYLINNNNYAADAVQREANAVADIYRETAWLREPIQVNMQTEIKNYLNNVINVEWSLMEQGKKINFDGDVIINNMSNELKHYHATNNAELMTLHNILDDIKTLYDARQQRIQMSYTALAVEIWVVILIGTTLTLCINYLFGMNFYLHIITVISAAIMTSAIIFLLITLDRPFQGEFSIQPNAFQAVLNFIEK